MSKRCSSVSDLSHRSRARGVSFSRPNETPKAMHYHIGVARDMLRNLGRKMTENGLSVVLRRTDQR
jgi:hypothetical protein